MTVALQSHALLGLLREARRRIALLAALNFAWFMVLPCTIWLLSDARESALIAILAGILLELSRLFARHSARRSLRHRAMSGAAQDALAKTTITSEVVADSAFWSAHIVEYAASIDIPAVIGAALAVLVTLGLAASRSGVGFVLQVGTVLLCGVALGILSSRQRRASAYSIVDARERTTIWMAAAVRDRGELSSVDAKAAFLRSLASAVEDWCRAEDRSGLARTAHRLSVAFVTSLALYAVARHNGLDPLGRVVSGSPLEGSLSGTALLGASLPSAYALVQHLDSLAVASLEMGRLALNAGPRRIVGDTRLPQPPRLLRARSVVAYQGQTLALALRDADISLGHLIGIAGPNGSGKTTLATAIAGLLVPTSGALRLDDVLAHEVSRCDVAFVPQDPVLIEALSVLENLRLVAPEFAHARALALLSSLGLECALEMLAGKLSRGEQRRIAIARAILKAPKLLVLDEPDAWLDVEGRRMLTEVLGIVAQSASVVVVSHRADTLLRLETVIVLNADHQIELIDSPVRLRANSPTFSALVGGGSGHAPERLA